MASIVRVGSHVLALFFPSSLLQMSTPYTILESLILWPLEFYESLAIIPVSFVRRHMPLLGGALVILMALHGILLRLFLDMLHGIFARITYSNDPVLNFRTFWLRMRDRYAFFPVRQIDWNFVHQLFGDAIVPTTSEDDLWIAMQESIAMCDDPSLVVTRSPQPLVVRGRALPIDSLQRYEAAALQVMETRHLTDFCGRRVANNFVFGMLNAETSPGWRIGYICLTSMDGFVDFPVPRMDALFASSSPHTDIASTEPAKQNLKVPEIYDLESMRWTLDAILKSLGETDGLILDLRFNQGGGSLMSALSIASFFAGPKRSVAFMTDEKQAGDSFSRKKRYYIPCSYRSFRYRGAMAVLQSQYTRGTAELLCLSLMNRPNTCRIGATTAGSLSQTEKLRLPNYWTVDVPYQRCFSADGQLYEGVGIPPETPVNDMEAKVLQLAQQPSRHCVDDGDEAFDPCIKKAMEHIMKV